MMEFLEMENEANSDYVLNQFLLGNIRFWTVSDIVCRSTSSFLIEVNSAIQDLSKLDNQKPRL